MKTKLKHYFPMLREREVILKEIYSREDLTLRFQSWNSNQQAEFLDFCTGVKGVKLLYDSFFKAIMNPEYAPGRINDLLSLLLNQKVHILKVLPNESVRITAEDSLLVMDMVIALEDGSIANLEVQKIGYAFPGQRSACYSADLLLRQYKRVRQEMRERGEKFNYRHIKKVYTIVLFEKSTREFHRFPELYLHRMHQQSDTGLEMDLLQEFLFVALDIFQKKLQNKGVETKLEAWLTFLSTDDPEIIIRLIEAYPEFRDLYEEVYSLCRNTEQVMNMYSKELEEYDKNTVQYMIDEMQDTIDSQKNTIDLQQDTINSQKDTINSQKDTIDSQQDRMESMDNRLREQSALIEALQKQMEELKKQRI